MLILIPQDLSMRERVEWIEWRQELTLWRLLAERPDGRPARDDAVLRIELGLFPWQALLEENAAVP